MEVEAATICHVSELFERPADRMKVEYRNAGASVPEAKSYFLSLVSEQQAVAFKEGDRLLAVLGWDTSTGEVVTSFVAIEDYFDRRYVRFLREYVKIFQKERMGVAITSHSYSEDPRTPKWFSLLGFRMKSEDGVHRTYHLPAKT